MKRIVVWSWSKDPSIIPIETLIESGEVEVALWVTMRGNKSHKTKNFSYIPEIMLHDLALQEKRNDVFYPSDPSQLAEDVSKFMDIYSRVNFSKGLDYFDHLNLFHLYYQYFTHILVTKKVDCLIYFTLPHAGADYILYLAAKALGVDVLLTFQSHTPNRFYCIKDIQDFGDFETTPPLGEPTELTIPREFKKDLFYMKKAKHKRGLSLGRFARDIYWAIFTGRQPIKWAGVVQKQAGRIACRRQYKKNAVFEVDMNRKFVYFPLQLQPELTTSILGNEFSDQLLAMEKLSVLLPDDWYIYAKENPKQGFQQRNDYFFDRLNRINNCIYLSDTISTYELMDNSQFVASITGTACWEAVSGAKPALIFGNVWFKRFPGISMYEDGMTLSDIMDNKFTHEELEEKFNEVMSKTMPGIVDMRYTEIYDDFDEAENGRLLTQFLRDYFSLNKDSKN